MEVQPASISQVQVGEDGRVYEISAESSTVVADLQAMDKGLKVRFSERGQCFIVRHEHHDGCPHNGTVGEGGSYLVSTVQAYQGRTGVWTGLDQRLVDRIRFIDPHGRSGYNYADELEKASRKAREDQRRQFTEKMGDIGERAAHALRKDLGQRYKGRAFVPRDAVQ